MTIQYYTGQGIRRSPDHPVVLPASRRAQLMNPELYRPDPGLVDACNVALMLNQPLLLTGEPGTGKTLFAYSLAWELGLGDPLKFETKSNSTARELFYTYDALQRFQDAQSGSTSIQPLAYLTYNALGAAILKTRSRAEIDPLVPPEFDHQQGKRSVVLIDEVDKAPRDFPNDILNELDQQYFRVMELGNVKVEAAPDLQPIVIITSNSEKDLPDAFLRRCVYYNIPFPRGERLAEIVANRLGLYAGGTSPFLTEALDLFFKLRSPESGLRKKPATAELLGWMVVLQERSNQENPLADRGLALRTLSSLIKTAEDQEKATRITQHWVEGQKP